MASEIEFNKIYEEYYPRIFKYISRIAGHIHAEDITQEVFEKVSRNLGNFRGRSKFSTWLYRIATNNAIDKMRSVSFKRSFNQLPLEDIDSAEDRHVWSDHKADSTDQEMVRKEMSECVREFIDNLPSDYKTVIVLSELEGLTNREIAEILNISLDNVKMRLHRSRAKLREALNDGCNFYHNEENVLACDRKPSEILPNIPK